MDDQQAPLRVGDVVPPFELPTFEPSTGEFGRFRVEDARGQGRWTILFFYPADFTFV